MVIEKFKKDKSNTYLVYFDDGTTIKLFDDVIIKYNLLNKKNLNKELFNDIVNYNDFLEGYYKSIGYINRKLRTELEIRKYLEKIGISYDFIDKIILLLNDNGYLNKDLYIKAYVNDQYNLTLNGPYKIIKDLVGLGYNKDEIDLILNNYDWSLRIEKIINKKLKSKSNISNNALKNKIYNDIIKLGYEREDVIYYLDKVIFTDDYEVLIKELIKIKRKYSKKYEGYDLENKVITYLFRKGFNIDDVKRCYNEN